MRLALRCQIAKQFSGLNLFSLSNNKIYRLKTRGVFYCNKHNAVEFIVLLKRNLPSKNVQLRQYLVEKQSFIYIFVSTS